MTGETELAAFLRQMEPHLHERLHVFCSVDPATYEGLGLNPLGMFREAEGITLTMDQWQADEAGLMCVDRWACITLTVHSALTAVGFIAAIGARLVAAGLTLITAGAIYTQVRRGEYQDSVHRGLVCPCRLLWLWGASRSCHSSAP